MKKLSREVEIIRKKSHFSLFRIFSLLYLFSTIFYYSFSATSLLLKRKKGKSACIFTGHIQVEAIYNNCGDYSFPLLILDILLYNEYQRRREKKRKTKKKKRKKKTKTKRKKGKTKEELESNLK